MVASHHKRSSLTLSLFTKLRRLTLHLNVLRLLTHYGTDPFGTRLPDEKRLVSLLPQSIEDVVLQGGYAPREFNELLADVGHLHTENTPKWRQLVFTTDCMNNARPLETSIVIAFMFRQQQCAKVGLHLVIGG